MHASHGHVPDLSNMFYKASLKMFSTEFHDQLFLCMAHSQLHVQGLRSSCAAYILGTFFSIGLFDFMFSTKGDGFLVL